jgi:phosphatidylinositol alpha-1,6-mannosyltransferase
VSHTLFITNDFPPRPGGIQTFVYEIVSRFEPGAVTVLTSSWAGAAKFDKSQPYSVVRARTKLLLPTPNTLKLARKIVLEKNVKNVVFGAAAPLGLLSNSLRNLGVEKIVAFTHGHESGWAKTLGTKQLLQKIGNDVDVLTYLTNYTKAEISKGLSDSAKAKMYQLLPAVDPNVFSPANKVPGLRLRALVGFANRPTIVSVSRLMARKGHDLLISALPDLKVLVPGVALIIVGEGPHRSKLEAQVAELGLTDDVYFTGSVPFAQLPNWYAAGDVFAMPCRTRKAGWDVEGLGIVYLEASASGLPVIAGNSGGAPEAVLDGKSGYVVDGVSKDELINRLVQILSSEKMRTELGAFGRQWVLDQWTWEKPVARLKKLLANQNSDN